MASGAVEPARDCLEPEFCDRDWQFGCNHILIARLSELVFDLTNGLRIRGTTDELRPLKATDRFLDNPRLEAEGATQPLGASALSGLGGERILKRKRHQNLHLDRPQRLLA